MDEKLIELLEHPPPGIKVLEQDRYVIAFQHRTSGMGCLASFLLVWLGGWTFFCGLMVKERLFPHSVENAPPQYMLPVLLAGEVLVIAFALQLFFVRRNFRLENGVLTLVIRFLVLAKVFSVSKYDVVAVGRRKDGSQEDGSLPTWALSVDYRDAGGMVRERSLMFRQTEETVMWIGRVLSAWSNAPFDHVLR